MSSRPRRVFDLMEQAGGRFRLIVEPQFNETIEEAVLRSLDGRILSIRSYNKVAKASLLDEEARRHIKSRGGKS